MGAGPVAAQRRHRQHCGVFAHDALQKAAPAPGDLLVLPHHGLRLFLGCVCSAYADYPLLAEMCFFFCKELNDS